MKIIIARISGIGSGSLWPVRDDVSGKVVAFFFWIDGENGVFSPATDILSKNNDHPGLTGRT